MKLEKIQKMSRNALEKLSEKSEFTIQCEIVSYARSIGLLIFAVPNEATRGEAKYKRSGVLAGVSDLVLCKDGIVWFIELKDYKGVQSASQKEFEGKVTNYVIIRSLNEFRLFLESTTD